MDAPTLTDRYVDAAMRTVPERQRSDLAAELRASIVDGIDARVEAGEGPEAAERAVLTELGDPDKLAAGYLDRPLWLVGPRYYLDWLRLLKVLLWIVPVCAAFGVALGQVLSGAGVGEAIGAVVGVVFSVIVHVCFWVTLVFFVLERTGHETMDPTPWTPDRLPEPRESGARFADLVASLVFLALVAGALLWDQALGLANLDGHWMPALDPRLWPWWIIGLLVLMGGEAIVAMAVYARHGWTIRLAVANGILNAAIAIPALWLLWQHRLVNPEVLASLADLAGATVFGPGGIVPVVIGLGIAAVAVWDTVDAFRKAVRTRR